MQAGTGGGGERMPQEWLIWDAHACLPLHPDADFGVLERHRRAGCSFVSVNIGMDMNPLPQIMAVIASFNAQLAAAPDRFVAARRVADVEAAHATGRLAVAFDLEGAIPLLGRPEMVRLYAALGVRQMHLAYNRNNPVGGGCYDDDVPLTPLGRKVVAAINEAGVLMDCSHTGHRTSLDVMAASSAPVIFSHANPRALCDDGRNITDEQIRACIATGGVVCVNGVGRFLGDHAARTPAILAHIDHLVQRYGARNVGLGIDYSYPANGLDDDPPGLDKDYWWPPAHGYVGGLNIKIASPEQLPEIIRGMQGLGYDKDAIGGILGHNMQGVARRVWG
jgi:membrane dipeptidase